MSFQRERLRGEGPSPFWAGVGACPFLVASLTLEFFEPTLLYPRYFSAHHPFPALRTLHNASPTLVGATATLRARWGRHQQQQTRFVRR